MRKRVFWSIVLVLAAAGAVLYVFMGRDIGGFSSGSGDRIQVSGNIELTEVKVAFKTPGKLIERTVDEGDPVHRDQKIARLDHAQLSAQKDRELAGLQVAKSMFAQAETRLNWQRQNQSAELEQRTADLNAYLARLQELKSGSRPQEIQEAKAAVDSAQAGFDRAGRDWDRAQTLYKNDDISTAQYDQFRSHWESADAALKQARERYDLVLAGPREEQIKAAAAQVERARAAVKMAQSNTLEIKRLEQELSLRRAEIARAEAGLALIDSQLADTVALSPVEGVVLVKAADVGEILAAGIPVVTIGDIDHPWLRAYINETDLGRVKLGAKAEITTDSYPGKAYRGRVSFIASEAEFTPKQIQTQEERVKLVYRIKIDVANPRHELKSNMPADAVISLE